jgi:hypothetical protein
MVQVLVGDFLYALVFPVNIGMAFALGVLSTIPQSALSRWVIITGGAAGVAVLWLVMFQNPDLNLPVAVAYLTAAIAAFVEIAFATWLLRYKVGWSTPFQA